MLLLVEAVASIGVFTVPILAPVAAPDVGVDANQIGVFSALLFLGAMISSALSSNLVIGYGAIRVSQAGLVALACALALTTIASIAAFALGGVAIGLSYGLLTPAATHVLARHSPPTVMALVLSIKQSGNPLGGALAGVIVPMLVVAFGWRSASLAVASLCLAVAVLLQPFQGTFDDDVRTGYSVTFRRLVDPWSFVVVNPHFRELVVAGFFYGAMQTCIGSLLVVFLVEGLGLDLVTAGLTQSVAQISGMIGRVGWGAMVGRFVTGRRMLGMLGFVMSFAAITTAFFTTEWPVPIIMITSAILGATGTGWSGVLFAELARLAPAGEASRAAGGAASFSFVGAMLGPAGFSALVAATDSYSTGFLFVASMTVIPGILLSRSTAAN